MLIRNLIKTRLRASRMALIICCVVMLACSVVGSIITPIAYNFELFQSSAPFWNTMLPLIQGMLMMLCGLCWTGITTAFMIGMIFLFYSMFTMYGSQNAYLYFTLPCSRKDILHASLLTYLIESAILLVAGIVSALIYGITYIVTMANLMDPGIQDDIPTTQTPEVDAMLVILIIISILLMLVASIMLSVITPATCCVYGCSLAKKHKLIGTIVAAFAVNALQSTVMSVASFIPSIIFSFVIASSDNLETSVYAVPLLITVIALIIGGLAVLMYYLTKKQLEEKLDIE